jgi:hypothetical protein
MSLRSDPTPSREWTYVYVPVTLKGARLNVATVSTPALIVGDAKVESVYVDRLTTAGSRTS